MPDDLTAQPHAAGAATGRPPGPEDRTDRADRAGIEQAIRARYAAELAAADICDSLRLEVRIRAEIESALGAAAEPSTSPPPPPSRSGRPASRS